MGNKKQKTEPPFIFPNQFRMLRRMMAWAILILGGVIVVILAWVIYAIIH